MNVLTDMQCHNKLYYGGQTWGQLHCIVIYYSYYYNRNYYIIITITWHILLLLLLLPLKCKKLLSLLN